MKENKKDEKQQRLTQKLSRELGDDILSALKDADIVEVMLNPDGNLWFDSQSRGMYNTGVHFSDNRAHNLITTIASMRGHCVNTDSPLLETELPIDGSRFAGALPDVVTQPAFCIRKKALKIHSLKDYIKQGSLTSAQAQAICQAIQTRQSLLVVGGPGTGKTTLTNAILQTMVDMGSQTQRFVIIEDTRELQCSAPNTLLLKTTQFANHEQLLRFALRARPDKICMGEARGAEVLTLLKAWNTGTPGGIATLHANTAQAALLRIREMGSEAGLQVAPTLIAEAIDIIIALRFHPKLGRIVESILKLNGFSNGDYQFHTIA